MSGPTIESTSHLAAFVASLKFPLDDFQVQGCQAVEAGQGVLVAAPTGAGKTIVGEFGVHMALATGRKAFYTTPIKALSNQKYHDLVAVHGVDKVGLLTGDSSVNGEAPVVVMTTEVLRNMVYAGSSTLQGLGFVVMDEVHYLADRFRGAVWEEVIIHLPESVQVISLSATVSNAEEFGDWLAEVRGNHAVVVSEHRPVPLWQHMLVGSSMFDLFVNETAEPHEDGSTPRVSPDLVQAIRGAEHQRADGWVRGSTRDTGRGPERARDHGRDGRTQPRDPSRDHGRGPGRGGSAVASGGGGRGDRGFTRGGRPGGGATRAEVIAQLDRDGLLPAITFIFSRMGCEGAVGQFLSSDTRLIPQREGERIRRHVEERMGSLAEEDLGILGYFDFVEGLSRGFACHHAGMLPLFREIVEELFTSGRIRAVFATETLALGINMPARTVVLEKLVKFNGETHADITPAEYTQLTGRAGRRGIDIEGHAVVQWSRGLDPLAVGGLASTRTYPLRSSFRPTYNMAVNLVAQVGRQVARDILETSFAQFQADRAVVGLATKVRRNDEALDGYAESMHCDRGDFREYADLRRAIADAEKDGVRKRSAAARPRPRSASRTQDGRHHQGARGPALGLGRGRADRQDGQGRSQRSGVVTEDRQFRRLTLVDVPEPVEAPPRSRCPSTSTPSHPSRVATSRRRCASPCPTTHHRSGPRKWRRRPPRRTTALPSCAPSSRHTPATSAPSARTTRAGPSVGTASSARPPG